MTGINYYAQNGVNGSRVRTRGQRCFEVVLSELDLFSFSKPLSCSGINISD